MTTINAVFVTWDGPDQSYLESLYFPILREIQQLDDRFQFTVLQFSWMSREKRLKAAEAAAQAGLSYVEASILRQPRIVGEMGTLAYGAVKLRHVAHSLQANVILVRSIMPAALALLASVNRSAALVFDADGFMPDERIENQGWSGQSLRYSVLREIEERSLRTADAVLTRTHAAKHILVARGGASLDDEKVLVVRNGKDEALFISREDDERLRIRDEFGIDAHAPWIVAVGSVGPQYYPEQTIEFFESVHRRLPAARFHWITGQPKALETLHQRSSSRAAIRVAQAEPAIVPRILAAADLGVALRRPSFSQRGVCPIKVAEYLLCGLPVLATRGVGDLDEDLEGVGLLLDNVTSTGLEQAAQWFCEQVLQRRAHFRQVSRQRGLELFTLRSCARGYRDALLLGLDRASGRRMPAVPTPEVGGER